MAGRINRRGRVRGVAALVGLAMVAAACGFWGDDDDEFLPFEAVETVETTLPPETGESGDGAAVEPAAAPSEPAAPVEVPEGAVVAPVDTTTTVAPTEGEAAPEVPPEPVPQFGGTLRVGVQAESASLNPAGNAFTPETYVMAYLIFDPLAYYDTEGRWIPYLAEFFTKIDEGTRWQMKLREGVRFHDGTEVDADDVIATFNAQIVNPILSLVITPRFDPVDRIRKIDDYTVEYQTAKATAYFPASVTTQLGMVLPSEWLERSLLRPDLSQMPVGQGPFMVESRVQDEVTVLVRNPDYWAADLIDIYLDRIEIYPITDSAIAAERLAAGELDLIVATNADAILTLRDAEGVRTIENFRSSEGMVIMNTARPPFDDIRARQALTFSADRDAYINFISQGTSPPADNMFHSDLIWHNPDVKQETNMPERAGPLVASYCADFPENCTDGRINTELIFSGTAVLMTRIYELQSDSWEEFFNITPVQVLQDELVTQIFLGNYNIANWRDFGAVDPENDAFLLECGTIKFISLNLVRYCDPARDELLDEQRRIEDLGRRVQIWRQVQEMIRDSYTYIFYDHQNFVIGTRDNVHNVCGRTSPVDGTPLFCNNRGRIQLQQVWLS